MLSVAKACLAGDLFAAHDWPDALDGTMLALFMGAAFGLPLLGHWLMVLDVRRYLRSLRRAMVLVVNVFAPATPFWAVQDLPPCLLALELVSPCSEQQVLAAYRRRVKTLHPDHGGDLQQFLRLQKHFEQAINLVRSQAKAGATPAG